MITTTLWIKEDRRLTPWIKFKESDYFATSWEINEDIDKLLWLQNFKNRLSWICKWFVYECKKIKDKVKSILL